MNPSGSARHSHDLSDCGLVPFSFGREGGKRGAERSLARSGGSCGGGGGGGGGPGGERRTGERRPLGLRKGRATEGEARLGKRAGGRPASTVAPRGCCGAAWCALSRDSRGAGRGGRGLRATGARRSSPGVPLCVRDPITPGSLGLVGTRRFTCALPRWNCRELQRPGRSHTAGTWWDGDGPRPGLTFQPPPHSGSRLFSWGPCWCKPS